jgi:hypothetical protein
MRLLYNRNKRKYQQEQQRAIESNGEQQRLSAEASAQAQAQQLAAQLAHDRELVYIQTTAALDIKKAEFLYKIEEKKIDGLIKGDQINTQGTIDKEITHIQAKYNMDKMKGKDPVVKSKK